MCKLHSLRIQIHSEDVGLNRTEETPSTLVLVDADPIGYQRLRHATDQSLKKRSGAAGRV
jgi:hypothetical protein